MGIKEARLEVWSAQGSITQSASTYGTIKRVLEDSGATYASRDFQVFLQGSYGNDTNVYADSDVDIVIQLNSAWNRDLSRLSESQTAAYNQAYSNASYGWRQFRADVLDWLARNFDPVYPGTKAIDVPAGGNRRNADVLAAIQFRRYFEFIDTSQQRFSEGLCFYSGDALIENFPKQHSKNCTAKHQGTNQWFKPTVRCFKNLRNRMLEEGMIEEGEAPSYFIEGMLFNVPDEKFGSSFRDTFVECHSWLSNSEASKLVCANKLHWLVRDDQSTSWPTANYEKFLAALADMWNDP